MCRQSATACDSSSQCCAGLACSETRTEPTAPAVRQCCAGGSAACDTNEDCCGRMLCENGECQCVEHAGLCDRDLECCNGEICLVGSCQDGTNCRREMQLCNESMAGMGCCGMLSCLRHYSDDASKCCVGRDFRCRQDTDCCGDMTCDQATERCVGRTLGQSCDTQFDCIDGLSCVEPATGAGTCQDLTP
jgi:hypothetical protein